MKQLLIAGSIAYASNGTDTVNTLYDAGALTKGSIALFKLDGSKVYSGTDTLSENFGIALGRGDKSNPIIIPEVDIKSLTVSTAVYNGGTNTRKDITISTSTDPVETSITFIRKGVGFNERNKWTVSTVGTGAVAVGTELVKRLSASLEPTDMPIVVVGTSANVIEVQSTDPRFDFDIQSNAAVTNVSTAVTPVGDVAYIKDLASKCAAGKGFNYLAEDGKEIYPGYPEEIASDKYDIYNLRFAVPRASAKTRDEVASQVVHIAVPYYVRATVGSQLDALLAPFTRGYVAPAPAAAASSGTE